MGCDVHLHIEVKVDGEWEHYAQLSPTRSYAMFAKMAGVRRAEIEPIAQPRGLPADISKLTQLDAESWASDGHTWSWLNREEIGRLEAFFDDAVRAPGACGLMWFEDWVGTYLYGNGFTGRSEPWVEDVRFVFWFDN